LVENIPKKKDRANSISTKFVVKLNFMPKTNADCKKRNTKKPKKNVKIKN
jgi:hypothetical protein